MRPPLVVSAIAGGKRSEHAPKHCSTNVGLRSRHDPRCQAILAPASSGNGCGRRARVYTGCDHSHTVHVDAARALPERRPRWRLVLSSRSPSGARFSSWFSECWSKQSPPLDTWQIRDLREFGVQHLPGDRSCNGVETPMVELTIMTGDQLQSDRERASSLSLCVDVRIAPDRPRRTIRLAGPDSSAGMEVSTTVITPCGDNSVIVSGSDA